MSNLAEREEFPTIELFADVVGQSAAVDVLRSSARLPVHAYLFLGPRGSGSRTASRAFAAALLCPRGGCGECTNCQRALAGTHPDLVIVERVGASLGVEEARRLVGLAQRRPYESERQVIVVDDVHLAIRSAPALLKTIEEPPISTVFILLADNVPPELVTVASRCFEVTFPPVADDAVERWLLEKGIEASRAAAVSGGAGGDLDRARLLAEDGGYSERVEMWRSVPARLDRTGAASGRLARALLEAIDSAVEPMRVLHADQLSQLEEESRSMGERALPGRREVMDRYHREERRWRTDELRAGLGLLAGAYRDRLVDCVNRQDSDRLPEDLEVQSCAEAITLITRAAESLERNPNETLLLESLLARLGEATV